MYLPKTHRHGGNQSISIDQRRSSFHGPNHGVPLLSSSIAPHPHSSCPNMKTKMPSVKKQPRSLDDRHTLKIESSCGSDASRHKSHDGRTIPPSELHGSKTESLFSCLRPDTTKKDKGVCFVGATTTKDVSLFLTL